MFNTEEFKKVIREALSEVMEEQYGSLMNQLSGLLTDSNDMRMYSIPQVAAMMHRSSQTIRRWISQGLLVKTKNNLISQAAINDYINYSKGLKDRPNYNYSEN